MNHQVIGKTCISPLSFGSFFSYELRGDYLIGLFLGLIPLTRMHLSKADYLRLATRDEVPALYLLLNWPHFITSSRRATCPVYILQTRKRRRILLKLKGDMHFKLRQVLGRRNQQPKRRAAA